MVITQQHVTYLIPINFHLPLILDRGVGKLEGPKKSKFLGGRKLKGRKGTEIISKPFENGSLRLDSYLQDINIHP